MAFVVPATIFMMNNADDLDTKSSGCYPKVMVISPTRELAIQTNEVFESIGLFKSLCVYGGASRMMQYNDLRSKRPQVIVGTPGRINDFLEASAIHLSKCTYLGRKFSNLE